MKYWIITPSRKYNCIYGCISFTDHNRLLVNSYDIGGYFISHLDILLNRFKVSLL